MRIYCLISDHGFGHAARSTAVLKQLAERGACLKVVSAVPEWFFRFHLSASQCSYLNCQVDVGLKQKNSLEPDYSGTIKALTHFWETSADTIQFLAADAKTFGADLIYFDLPALAPLLAEAVDCPCFGMGNFSWDWIYQDLAENAHCDYASDRIDPETQGAFIPFIELHRKAYAKTTVLFTLPYSGDFSVFPKREPVNWVTHPPLPNAKMRTIEQLQLPKNKKYALLSFGGHDLPLLEISHWQIPENWHLILVGKYPVNHPKLSFFTNADLKARALDYRELVATADVVITKPGYGILTDCLINHTPMLHLTRGRFAEYPRLLDAMDALLPHRQINREQVQAADFFTEAEALCGQKGQNFAADGATQIAEAIINFSITKS